MNVPAIVTRKDLAIRNLDLENNTNRGKSRAVESRTWTTLVTGESVP